MLTRATYLSFILSAALLSGCVDEDVDVKDVDVRHGSQVQAVSPGHCEIDDCGSKGKSGTCYCDDLCLTYNDCCANAGAVCGIGCEPVQCELACSNGFKFDANGCETCECKEPMCGGFANIQCADGLVCVDDPGDSCDPQNGGADCSGICIQETCGGIANLQCSDSTDYCDVGGSCGAGDTSGVCTTRPQFCTQQYAPVCGCDGQTYGNQCTAAANGVSVATPGPCTPQTEICGGIANLQCEDPTDYCNLGNACGADDMSGACEAKPQACTQQYDPVCGCDGQSYGNACSAAANGVSVAASGLCVSQATNTCNGHCGGMSEDQSCWCDALCMYYGDCCGDKSSFCS